MDRMLVLDDSSIDRPKYKGVTMPYKTVADLPEATAQLPDHAKTIFMAAFNAAHEEHKSDPDVETIAMKIAWSAVNKSYRKDGGTWVKASEGMYYVNRVALTDGDTTRVQALRVGTFFHPVFGKFTITPELMDTMVLNFKDHRPKSPTELVVDYEHQSGKGVEAIAAGWIKGLERVGGELFMNVSWTEAAAKRIRDREYRFISPEFAFHYVHKETGKDIGPTLLAAALTNRPFVEGMQPVVLCEAEEGVLALSESRMRLAETDDLPDECFAHIGDGAKGETPQRQFPYKDINGKVDAEMVKRAIDDLNHANLSPEDKAKAGAILDKAMEEMSGMNLSESQYTELKTLADSAAALAIKLTEADAKIVTVVVERDTAIKALAEATKSIKLAEADTAVKSLVEKRKLLPAQAQWAKSLFLSDKVAFDSFAACAPVVGPEGGERGSNTPTTPADEVQLTESEVKIGARLGLTEADLIASKKRNVK